MFKVGTTCYYMYNQTYPGEESLLSLLRSVFFQPLLFCSSQEADTPATLCQPWESLSFPDLVYCPKIDVLDVAQKTMKHQ